MIEKVESKRIDLDALIDVFINKGYGRCGYTKYDIGGYGHFAVIPIKDKDKYIKALGEQAKETIMETAEELWDDTETKYDYKELDNE